MSRGQFVRNTLSAIQTQLAPSSGKGSSTDLIDADEASLRGAVGAAGSESLRGSLRGSLGGGNGNGAQSQTATVTSESEAGTYRDSREGRERERVNEISRRKRSDSVTSWNSLTRDVVAGAVINGIVINGGSGAGGSANASGVASPTTNDSTASVSVFTTGSGTESKTPSTLVSSVVYDRNWENDMESLLKVR